MMCLRRRRTERRFRREAPSSDESPDSTSADVAEDAVRKVQAVLLAYLRAANYPPWPGADGLMVEDALSAYAQARTFGLVPGLAELRDLHPDLADTLPRFFRVDQRAEK
jgi:hypothetical protein